MVGRRDLIGPGERAPDFVLPRAGGEGVRFYGVVGGAPGTVVFDADGDAAVVTELVDALRRSLADEASVHVVAGGDDAARATGGFHDAERHVHGAYGVASDGPPVVVVLDPNVRVTAVHTLEDLDTAIAAVSGDVDAAAHDQTDATMRRHAPVLLVPGALDAALCDRLVDLWGSGDTVETGVETTADGARHEVRDELRKRRRDHTVTDGELVRTLTDHIGRRVMPEVGKAFAYRATRFEGFKVGCYQDTDRGFFEPHRDNLSAATAHRRFALTLNLNDDYEGGELRFPEYGRQRYRPAKGEALVFSGSHLHEVLPVTRGHRFVLLSFLFGEDAVRR